jgi:hypothetical protein
MNIGLKLGSSDLSYENAINELWQKKFYRKVGGYKKRQDKTAKASERRNILS